MHKELARRPNVKGLREGQRFIGQKITMLKWKVSENEIIIAFLFNRESTYSEIDVEKLLK